MKLATAAQMRAMDARAEQEFGVPGVVLMENAACRVADEIVRRYGRGKRCVAVCGTGNNGGDGVAVVRQLTSRYGWDGVVALCGEAGGKSTPERDANLDIARRGAMKIVNATGEALLGALRGADVVIDALLGTGARGDPRPPFADAIRAINEQAGGGGRVVAIDVPSGVDADTGDVGEPSVRAAVTVTLALAKPGLFLDPAREWVGELVVGELGWPRQIVDDNPALTNSVTDAGDVARWLPARAESRDSNKGQYGSVALFSGSLGFAGAPTLCCLGAVRSGAGLVTLGAPEGMLDVMMARLPDVVMARGFPDTGGRQFRASSVGQALEFVDKTHAVGIGPGIGHENAEIRGFVREFVARCPKPMVIDADALNCLAAEPDHGASVVRRRGAATILTPHPGEMGRLMGMSTQEVQAARWETARRAAEMFGCVALLKGDRTLVAAPDGRMAINVTGNPGMASGGMGDILTGVASTLLAQVKEPFAAAAAAAYVHGLAGDRAAARIGKAGLAASDLGDELPGAIRHCWEESLQ